MAFARILRIEVDAHTYQSSNSRRKAANIKQFQERVQATNSAGFKLMQGLYQTREERLTERQRRSINKQIVAQLSRVQAAN